MQLDIKLLFEKPAIAYMIELLFFKIDAGTSEKVLMTNIGMRTFYFNTSKIFKQQSN